jgi:hypothetical protein
VLIDSSELIVDPALMPGPGSSKGRRCQRVAGSLLGGGRTKPGGNAETVRATWDLAQKVTHSDLGHIDAYAAGPSYRAFWRELERLATGADDDDEARWRLAPDDARPATDIERGGALARRISRVTCPRRPRDKCGTNGALDSLVNPNMSSDLGVDSQVQRVRTRVSTLRAWSGSSLSPAPGRKRNADLRIEFPVVSGRYPLVSDVVRDRYGINRLLKSVTTLRRHHRRSGSRFDGS